MLRTTRAWLARKGLPIHVKWRMWVDLSIVQMDPEGSETRMTLLQRISSRHAISFREILI